MRDSHKRVNVCFLVRSPLSFLFRFSISFWFPFYLTHHFILVVGTEEHAPWPSVQLVVVEAGPAHGGGVHNGRHLCEVVQKHLVEECFIAVLQQHTPQTVE